MSKMSVRLTVLIGGGVRIPALGAKNELFFIYNLIILLEFSIGRL